MELPIQPGPINTYTNPRDAYNSFITNLQANPSQDTYNSAASFIGNNYGSSISPQEYLGALSNIYGAPKTQQSNQNYQSLPIAPATPDYASLYQAGRNDLNSSIGTSIQGSGTQLQGGILDYLDSLKQQQQGIDQQSVQNNLSKIQGTRNVNASVGQNIRSAGLMLGNRNAGSSSAVQGLADAYGQQGRYQLGQVGNQYAQGQQKIQQAQDNLGNANNTQIRHTQEQKTGLIDGIINAAQAKLAQLDQYALQGGLPNRINFEQEKAQIKQQALDQLAQYDQMLSSGIAQVAPSSVDQNYATANNLSLAGQAPDTAFNFTSSQPLQFQNTGPSPSSLPLFTFPGNKKQLA